MSTKRATLFLIFILAGATSAFGQTPVSQAPLLQAPLLQDGKKTLYQRILTTPGCMLVPDAGEPGGTLQPAFTRFYVYERKDAKGQTWLRVGPDSFGKTSGWLAQGCAVDWKMQMALAFTNPANRDRLLFFSDRKALENILNAQSPAALIAPLRGDLEKTGKAPNVVAEEPKFFVNIEEKFYLLPILSGEDIMTNAGFRVRVLNVASVSKEDKKETPAPNPQKAVETEPEAARQLASFRAGVVFVIDTTISMDPYIDGTRQTMRQIYKQIEAEGLQDQVRFGLVAFRSNTDKVPGLDYVSRIYADPNEVKSGADFFNKIKDLKQAQVSSVLFEEDSYAGVMAAVEKIDWNGFGARYIVLITDAGAIDGSDPLSTTGLSAAQVRLEAARKGLAIYTLHLKTPTGKNNHGQAETQYRDLSTYQGTNTQLYYSVNAGDVKAFGHMVDTLGKAIANQVSAAYMGETSAVGSVAQAETPPASAAQNSPEDERLQRDAAMIGHAMALSYLGQVNNTNAPPVFKAWISDRDLVRPETPTTEVRVLLTKGQLSDMSDVVTRIMDAANEGTISPERMFTRLRDVAVSMGTDPNKLPADANVNLAQMGILSEYLVDLPYRSGVMALDEATWKNWNAQEQRDFIMDLGVKLRHYQRYNEDVGRWISLSEGSDPRDHVYPVPLEMMP